MKTKILKMFLGAIVVTVWSVTILGVAYGLGMFGFQDIPTTTQETAATVTPAPTSAPTEIVQKTLPNITTLKDGYIAKGPGYLVLWHFEGKDDNSCVKIPVRMNEEFLFSDSWLEYGMFVQDERFCSGDTFVFSDQGDFWIWINNWQPPE